jgi:hypothetical protein
VTFFYHFMGFDELAFNEWYHKAANHQSGNSSWQHLIQPTWGVASRQTYIE